MSLSLPLCKMITLQVCLGNLLSVCRENGALQSDWPRKAAAKSAGKAQSGSGQILSILPPPYPTDTHTHIHTNTPPSGRQGGLTNRAFISCQSGFIGFKWSLITTVLQSSTTAFSSMGSVCECVSVGLFLKSSLMPNVLLFTFCHIHDFPF